MDKFINRLKFYLIGFGLGCVMVWAIFYSGDDARSSWLPEGRVLEFIEDTELKVINKHIVCVLECNNITISDLDKTFFKNAKVNFSESSTTREPCPEYQIEGKLADERIITLLIETCEPRRLSTAEEKEDIATIVNISFEGIKLDCLCE